MDHWLINGTAGNTLRLDDRGLNYGDGLFETIAVRGGRCRFLNAHIERLLAGCARLLIPPPDDRLVISEAAALAEKHDHATLKIIITRGPGPRGYRLPDPCLPARILGVERTLPVQPPIAGVRVRYCAIRLSRNVALAGIKTLNRLEQVLARAEWNSADINEGLMLTDRDEVIGGTMTNLFFGCDGILFTPLLTECGINGIMRQQVFAVARELGIEIRELPVSKSMLFSADEIFLTNALIGMWPVSWLEGSSFQAGPLTARIRRALAERGVGECA